MTMSDVVPIPYIDSVEAAPSDEAAEMHKD
jgi:hypothetical protein